MPVSQLTVDELAAEVGLHPRTLARHLARGCPRDSADAVRAWQAENIQPQGEATLPEARLALIQEQTRREAAQAEKLEQENRVRSGELIERAEVKRDLSIAISRMQNRLNSLGTRLANISPTELKVPSKEMAEELVRIVLKEMIEDLSDEA